MSCIKSITSAFAQLDNEPVVFMLRLVNVILTSSQIERKWYAYEKTDIRTVLPNPSESTKPLTNRSTLEALRSCKTLAWQQHYGAVTAPSMMLLVAQSTISECLWCVQTTGAMSPRAGAQSFFCVEARTLASRERYGHLALLSP